MKKSFYERCLELRDFYLTYETDNQKVTLLSKLVAISFYNSQQLDNLPREITLSVNCYGLSNSLSSLEESLKKVLSDLQFKRYQIKHNSNFYISHEMHFVIYE